MINEWWFKKDVEEAVAYFKAISRHPGENVETRSQDFRGLNRNLNRICPEYNYTSNARIISFHLREVLLLFLLSWVWRLCSMSNTAIELSIRFPSSNTFVSANVQKLRVINRGSSIYDAANVIGKQLLSYVHRGIDGLTAARERHIMISLYISCYNH
jgi:hypothetical protein